MDFVTLVTTIKAEMVMVVIVMENATIKAEGVRGILRTRSLVRALARTLVRTKGP
jgi:hypothetical protein